MATKSKKIAVKKGPPRTSTPSQVGTKAGEVEDVSEAPDLMTPAVMKQLAQVETVIGRVDQMTVVKLAENITKWAGLAADYSRQAVQAGASALVYAWACGKLLNAAKEDLGHGDFGKWRKEHLESAGISERTSTRYMTLAAQCHDVRGLLQWAPTLKQAYVGCGILPGPPEREKDPQYDDESEGDKELRLEEEQKIEVQRKKEVLLAGVSDLQQKLHQGISIRENLDKGEVRQLTLARIQIYAFFEQILGKKQ